jgi:hypothetical protein
MSNKIIWQATISADMVEDWTDNEIELFIADLDDAVKLTYEDWELRD